MTDKQIKIPGPDHPITIEVNPSRVVVKVGGKVIADTRDALNEHFSSEQIVEMTLIVSMANFTNRFNNGLELKPEE